MTGQLQKSCFVLLRQYMKKKGALDTHLRLQCTRADTGTNHAVETNT